MTNLIDQESGKNLICAERALRSERMDLYPHPGVSVLNECGADLVCVQKCQGAVPEIPPLAEPPDGTSLTKAWQRVQIVTE